MPVAAAGASIWTPTRPRTDPSNGTPTPGSPCVARIWPTTARWVRARLSDLLPLVAGIGASWSSPDRGDSLGAGPDALGGRPAFVWGSKLSLTQRYGVADLLVRAPDGGYLPVIVRGHRTLDPGEGAECSNFPDPLRVARRPDRRMRAHHSDGLALAHLTRLLEDLGLSSSDRRGGVIGKGGPALDPAWDEWAIGDRLASAGSPAGSRRAYGAPGVGGAPIGPTLLEEYDVRFADRLAVASAAANGRPALPSRPGSRNAAGARAAPVQRRARGGTRRVAGGGRGRRRSAAGGRGPDLRRPRGAARRRGCGVAADRHRAGRGQSQGDRRPRRVAVGPAD